MGEFRAYSCNPMRRADLASHHLIFLSCNMDPNEWSRGGSASVCSAPSPMQEARGHWRAGPGASEQRSASATAVEAPHPFRPIKKM